MQQGELSFMHREKIGDLTKLWKTELLTAINLTESLLADLKGQLLGKRHTWLALCFQLLEQMDICPDPQGQMCS